MYSRFYILVHVVESQVNVAWIQTDILPHEMIHVAIF